MQSKIFGQAVLRTAFLKDGIFIIYLKTISLIIEDTSLTPTSGPDKTSKISEEIGNLIPPIILLCILVAMRQASSNDNVCARHSIMFNCAASYLLFEGSESDCCFC